MTVAMPPNQAVVEQNERTLRDFATNPKVAASPGFLHFLSAIASEYSWRGELLGTKLDDVVLGRLKLSEKDAKNLTSSGRTLDWYFVNVYKPKHMYPGSAPPPGLHQSTQDGLRRDLLDDASSVPRTIPPWAWVLAGVVGGAVLVRVLR